MFGLVFLYFIGKYFYELAFEYEKNKWKYAILGVVVYYATAILSGLLFGVIYVFLDKSLEKDDELLISVLSVPFGILACYLFYKYLAKKWEKDKDKVINEIDKIGEV